MRWPFSWPRRSGEAQPARDAAAQGAGALPEPIPVAQFDAAPATPTDERGAFEVPVREMLALGGPVPLTVRAAGFVAGLAGTHRLAPILRPPAHDRSASAPGGVVAGLSRVVATPVRRQEPGLPGRVVARLAADLPSVADLLPAADLPPVAEAHSASDRRPGADPADRPLPAVMADVARAESARRRLPSVAPDAIVMPHAYTSVEPSTALSVVAPHPILSVVPLQRDVARGEPGPAVADGGLAQATSPASGLVTDEPPNPAAIGPAPGGPPPGVEPDSGTSAAVQDVLPTRRDLPDVPATSPRALAPAVESHALPAAVPPHDAAPVSEAHATSEDQAPPDQPRRSLGQSRRLGLGPPLASMPLTARPVGEAGEGAAIQREAPGQASLPPLTSLAVRPTAAGRHGGGGPPVGGGQVRRLPSLRAVSSPGTSETMAATAESGSGATPGAPDTAEPGQPWVPVVHPIASGPVAGWRPSSESVRAAKPGAPWSEHLVGVQNESVYGDGNTGDAGASESTVAREASRPARSPVLAAEPTRTMGRAERDAPAATDREGMPAAGPGESSPTVARQGAAPVSRVVPMVAKARVEGVPVAALPVAAPDSQAAPPTAVESIVRGSLPAPGDQAVRSATPPSIDLQSITRLPIGLESTAPLSIGLQHTTPPGVVAAPRLPPDGVRPAAVQRSLRPTVRDWSTPADGRPDDTMSLQRPAREIGSMPAGGIATHLLDDDGPVPFRAPVLVGVAGGPRRQPRPQVIAPVAAAAPSAAWSDALVQRDLAAADGASSSDVDATSGVTVYRAAAVEQPVASSNGPGPAAPATAGTSGFGELSEIQLDQLARRLYWRISDRLRAELLRERERAGTLPDL